MNKMSKRIFIIALADLVFVFHCFIGILVLFGWLFPHYRAVYLTLLLVWLLCWVFLKHCPVTRWEFLLRKIYDKKIDPNEEIIKYYIHKVFKKVVSLKTIFTIGMIVFVILVLLSFTAPVLQFVF